MIKVRQANNKEQQLKELEKALKLLKRKLIKEGFFQALKDKRHYVKPSEIRHQKNMALIHKRKVQRRGKNKKR